MNDRDSDAPISPSQPVAAGVKNAGFDAKKAILGLVLLSFVSHAPCIPQPFVDWDDEEYVLKPPVSEGLSFKNVILTLFSVHALNYHPLTTLSMMTDVSVFGLNAWGFKLHNVILHTISTVLVFLFFHRTTGRILPSAFVAAIFSIHPLRVESVAWVSERKDVLSAMFILLAMNTYVSYTRSRSVLWLGATMLAFALSLLSKQTFVTFPALLVLLDIWPLRRWKALPKADPQKSEGLGWLIMEKASFIPLSALACMIIYRIQAGGPRISSINASLEHRIDNSIVTYVIYLKKLFWPNDLIFFYPYNVEGYSQTIIGVSMAIVAFVTLLAIVMLWKAPYVAVGWFWYLGTLLPVIGLVQVGLQGYADRYTYFPMIGIIAAVTWIAADLIARWPAIRPVLGLAGVAAVLTCMPLTWRQIQTWSSSDALANHALQVWGPNYRSYSILAHVESKYRGDWEKAYDYIKKCVELSPPFYPTDSNYVLCSLATGRVDEAEKWLNKMENQIGRWAATSYEFGVIHLGRNQLDDAIVRFKEVIELEPTLVRTWLPLGIAHARKGNFDEALACFEKSKPAGEESLWAIELVTAMKAGDKSAENRFRQLFYWPVLVEGSRMRADAATKLFQRGVRDRAISEMKASIEIWPTNCVARYNLGLMYTELGRRDEALALFRELVQLNPYYRDARVAIGLPPEGALPRKKSVEEFPLIP